MSAKKGNVSMKINLLLDVYGHWSGCIFLASFLSVLNRQLYWCILGGRPSINDVGNWEGHCVLKEGFT